jgi:hypothetical protein
MDTLTAIDIPRPRDLYVQSTPEFQKHERELRQRLDSFA